MIRDSIETARILVVSRDSTVLGALWSAGDSYSWQIEIAADAWDAMNKVQSGTALDLLLLDIPRNHGDSLQVLRALRRIRPALPVILIGHSSDVDRRQESIRMGARDYLMRPLEDHQLEMVIRSNLSGADEGTEIDITSEDVEAVGNGDFFIGISPVTRRLRAQIALLAEIDVPVFIFGESGTGKGTTARLLHNLSVRSGFEFARVKCAALPEDLLEREIFGAIGATESARAKRGKLELCDKGTIFLDEITEMPLRLQSNLVQVLQNRRFGKRGASESLEVDVRVVAASSISIDQAVAERRLLADLSRLLGAYELQVPALRERKDELPFLSRHFMHRLAKHYGLAPRDITPAVIEAWQAHDWPGNLRELEQLMKRYLVVGDKGLGFEKSPLDGKNEAPDAPPVGLQNANGVMSSPRQSRSGICGYKSLRALLRSVKEEAEKNAIALALEKTGWNRKAAARLLKTSYRTVLYKIEQYQMGSSALSSLPASNGFGTKNAESRSNGHGDVPIVDIPSMAGGR